MYMLHFLVERYDPSYEDNLVGPNFISFYYITIISKRPLNLRNMVLYVMKIILRKGALCKVWMLLSQLYLKKENIKKSLTFFPVRIYQLPPKLGEDLKSFWPYMVSGDYSVTETRSYQRFAMHNIIIIRGFHLNTRLR